MSESPNPKLLDALAGLDAEANMAVVQRTRRAVMEAAHQMSETKRRVRNDIGLVLLALGALLMFLTPTLWVVAEDVFNGEQWLDAPMLTALMVATTATTIFAAALAQWSVRSRGGESAGNLLRSAGRNG
jgi:high-affinity K+ transport system ATPase subunit B